MTEKKDKTKVEYGELNQLYDNKDVHEGINLDNENFVSLSRKTIKNNFVNTKINQGRLVGFVLQIKEPEKSEGIFGSLFLTHFYSDAFTLYINGNGGFIGNLLNQSFLNQILLKNSQISYYILIILILLLFLKSINFNPFKFNQSFSN